jgi:hypothetical protein
MEPIDQLNQDYPCDKRGGYGTKGCSCDGTQTTDKNRVKCFFHNRQASFKECRNCSHQKAYMRVLANKK